MRKVLVTGAAGQLGRRLMALAQSHPAGLEFVGMDREGLDITEREAIDRALDRIGPDAVINAAAYTAVDRAEQESGLAHRVNAIGPGLLAAACAARNIALAHVSTDYVFDGEMDRPYASGDATKPIGVYGRTKREGEHAVRSNHASSHVIRVAWLYDAIGPNFLHTMVKLGKEGRALRVVDDQWGTPTSALFFAEALAAWAADPAKWTPGIWHFGHLGVTTWHGFASAIFEALEMEVMLSPCSTEAYPTPAKRPRYSHLDPLPWHEAWGREPVHWREALRQCLAQMERNPS